MTEAPPDVEPRDAPAEDLALFEAARNGDRAAAEELVGSTYRFVYASLFKLCGGDRELASDLTQETYRKAWAATARFNGKARVNTWLYRIAYNSFLNHRRRPRRVLPLEDAAPESLEAKEPTPEELATRREATERLRRAVLDLPEPLRFVVSARYWGELTVREIAVEEAVSDVAVRKRIKRAMASIRAALEPPKDDKP